MTTIDIRHGDCLAVMRSMPSESVHAVITDPPYGLSNLQPSAITHAIARWNDGDRDLVPTGKGFMGREWDGFVPPPAVWDEVMRILVPGGHLAVFAGTRTVDIMGLSIRLAGFEMRDSLAAWLYGSGFPKSLDVSKAIDKAAGAEREVVGSGRSGTVRASMAGDFAGSWDVTAPATDAARQWEGWGSALKPAFEPILLARKPLSGTLAANTQLYGAGGIHVDACRVASDEALGRTNHTTSKFIDSANGSREAHPRTITVDNSGGLGRWPTNVLLAHHPEDTEDQCHPDCHVAALDEQSKGTRSEKPSKSGTVMGTGMWGIGGQRNGAVYDDSGGASRFFPTFRYQAKAPKRERPMIEGKGHPTVKPLGLMQWLVRLLVAEGGTLVDPFCGSGATGEAARNEGVNAILIDADEFSIALTKERIA